MTYKEARELVVQISDGENGLELPEDWREALFLLLDYADRYEDLRDS